MNSNEKEENVFEYKTYFGLAETNFNFFSVNIINFNLLRPYVKFTKNICGVNYVIKSIANHKSYSASKTKKISNDEECMSVIDPISKKDGSTIFTAGV